MASAMNEFEHLRIHLEELKKATNNFGCKVIGTGGFGKVFEGEVSHYKGRSIVAIKRLNRKFGQGDHEFFKEITTLSRYTHKNLISLLGFCDEDGEKILVYEHASNGSLDRHLSSMVLTWTQRIKICLDAAMGLAYLHDHKGTQQRVLHRDIKSANILLDDNWNAKLSDMGLSKIGPANQQHTFLFTGIVGTPGYCDPQYMEKYTLTKESDIYSFGVVLFEVLCGRLCFKYTNGQLELFVRKWKQSYTDKKLDEIIFKDLSPPLDPASLKTISDIAFQCLDDNREQRPTAYLLMKKLKIALEFQERHDMKLTSSMGTSHKSVDDPRALLSKSNTKSVDNMSSFLFGGKKSDLCTLLYNDKTKSGIAIQNEGPEDSGVRAFLAIKRAKPIVHIDGTISFTAEDLFYGSAEIVGKSFSGTYYKVILKNSDQVAVNKLEENILIEEQRKIKSKLNLLGKIRHPNLLTLRAYSKREELLIYDYMPKGRLCAFLHDQGPEGRVDWPTRMRIAKGVARGLHCLHNHHNMFHGTLTSSNIWLDENINPKISDFGMSEIMRRSGASLTLILGEQLGDVYGWGLIMLELLTGTSPIKTNQCAALPQWMTMLVNEDAWSSKDFDSELIKDASSVGRNLLCNVFASTLRVARMFNRFFDS